MLTAATLLIAQRWKSVEVPTLREWLSKVHYMCLVNKLSAMCRYGAGYVNDVKMFVTMGVVMSRYAENQLTNVKEYILSVL